MGTNNQKHQDNQNKKPDSRSDMRKHQYKDHDKVLTNDENYNPDTQKFKGEEPDFDDKLDNQKKK